MIHDRFAFHIIDTKLFTKPANLLRSHFVTGLEPVLAEMAGGGMDSIFRFSFGQTGANSPVFQLVIIRAL